MHRPKALIELNRMGGPPLALADRAYDELKHQILTCKLRPGDRLVERDLCDKIGISRTPLREALNRLGLEGLVSLVPYHGYQVPLITLQDIRDMCELRYIVEGEAAVRAAERATEKETVQLAELAELPYTPGVRETYDAYLRANSAFHLKLARCSHNARLEATLVSLLDQLQRPIYLGLDVGLNSEEATGEHLAIVEAVKKRDGSRAAAVTREQILKAEQRMIAAFASFNLEQNSQE